MEKILYLFFVILLIFFSIRIYKPDKTYQESDLSISSINYRGLSFPTCDSSMPYSLICFFAQAVCPSCIFDIMNYYNILSRSNEFSMSFVTVASNTQYKEIKQRIPTLSTLDVDSFFISTTKPLLFVTDENGVIIDFEIVSYETPYLTRDFMDKYSSFGRFNERSRIK